MLVQGWGQKVPEASLQEGWSGAGSLMAVSDEALSTDNLDPAAPGLRSSLWDLPGHRISFCPRTSPWRWLSSSLS